MIFATKEGPLSFCRDFGRPNRGGFSFCRDLWTSDAFSDPVGNAGVQPWWIQGIRRWGQSRRLWKNTYLITDIERLEIDSVVGRLVEKKRLNNLDYVE